MKSIVYYIFSCLVLMSPAYGQSQKDFDQYADGQHSPLSVDDPGSMGGFLSAYKVRGENNPFVRIPMEAYSVQIEIAKEKYGSLNAIPQYEWENIRSKTNELKKTLQTNEKYRQGNWSYDSVYRDLFKGVGGAIGGAAGTAVAPVGGTIAGSLLGAAVANKLLNIYESSLAGRVQVDSQNNYASSLRESANLVAISQLKINCELSKNCENIFNGIFASDFNKTPINSTFSEWIQNDPVLRSDRAMILFGKKLDELTAKMKNGANQNEIKELIQDEFNKLSQEMQQQFSEMMEKGLAQIQSEMKSPNHVFSEVEKNDVKATFLMGETLSVLFKDEKTAYAFREFGRINAGMMENYNSLQSGEMSNYAFAISTMNYFVIGMTIVNTLATKDNGPSFEKILLQQIQQIQQQIADLHKSMVEGFASVQSNIIISANETHSKIQEIKSLSERIREIVEATSLKNLKSNYSTFSNTRYQLNAKYQDVMESCFGSAIKQSAVCLQNLRAFATRNANYDAFDQLFISDLRQIMNKEVRNERPNSEFPYFEHWPALWVLKNDTLSKGNSGEKPDAFINDTIRTSPIPYYWSQASTSYLSMLGRILVEDKEFNKAGVISDLELLMRRGLVIYNQIYSMNYSQDSKTVNVSTHQLLLGEYFKRLNELVDYSQNLDLGDQYGRKYLDSIKQPLESEKMKAFSEMLKTQHGGVILPCGEAPESNFIVNPEEVIAHDGNFILSRVRELYNSYFNKNELAKKPLRFPTESVGNLVPSELIWAQNAKLGQIQICINKYRFSKIDLTNHQYVSNARAKNKIQLSAEVDIRFIPNTFLIEEFKKKNQNMNQSEQDFLNTNLKSGSFIIRYSKKSSVMNTSVCIVQTCRRWFSDITYAREFWADRTKGHDDVKNIEIEVQDMPMTSGLQKNASYGVGAAQFLDEVSRFNYSVSSDKIHKSLGEVIGSEAFLKAQDFYKAYYLYVMLGFDQIDDKDHSVANLFGEGKLPSPVDIMNFFVAVHPTSEDIKKLLLKRHQESEQYFKNTALWLEQLSEYDRQKKSITLKRIQKVLYQLDKMKRFLSET